MRRSRFTMHHVFVALRRVWSRCVRPSTPRVGVRGLVLPGLALLGILGPMASIAFAQCAEAPQLQNYTGTGQTVCPCFAENEQAGAVFTAPPGDYPLEILRVGIGWGSQFGGNPAQIENAINIYQGGLPNPGTPIFSLAGPQMTDGVINLFDLEPLPGNIVIPSGPFTVTLEFLNPSTLYGPSVVHDGNGCQSGKNVVYAIPGGWTNACALGVTGDWVFFVVYRPCDPATGIGDEPRVISTVAARLMPARPNPFDEGTDIEFFLAEPGRARVDVYDVTGKHVASLVDGSFSQGSNSVAWDGRGTDGRRLPSGIYFVRLQAAGEQSVKKVLLTH
jgi:hypothetical protein